VQALCALKLDLAAKAGLTQENQTIPASVFTREVDRAVAAEAERIKAGILVELDL